MKKFLSILTVATMLGFMACSGNQEATEVQEGDATVTEEMNNEMATEATEEALAEHVCSDQCTADAHVYKHSEKGHVCDAACHSEEATEGTVEEMNGDGE